MSVGQIQILALLAVTIVLFIWGRWRHDVIALSALLGGVLLGLVPAAQAFAGFGHPAVITVACVLVLSFGLESTGAVDALAKRVVPKNAGPTLTIAQGRPVIALALILIVTMTLSDFMNNAATAAVMCPIAISTATALSSNPDAFLMAVAIGASCSFLTPIGHQNNTLILGPGGFRFGDYWRLGLPMEVIVVAVAVPGLLYFWTL